MLVLGADPSFTNFGWALHDTEGVGLSRCLERGRFRTPAKAIFVDRHEEIQDGLKTLILRLGVQKIGLESPFFGGSYSEGMYALFVGVCGVLKSCKTDVVLFSPGQIKAEARNVIPRPPKWKMNKPDMVEAAKTDTGFKGRWKHDEADAYWAAVLAGRFWKFFEGGLDMKDLKENERKLFAEIHTYVRGKNAGKTVEKGLLFREDDRFFQWSKGE